MKTLHLTIRLPEPTDPAPAAIEALHSAVSWLCRNPTEPLREFPLFDRSGVEVGRAWWETDENKSAA